LTVTDNNGATGRDTMQVTVNAAANQAPVATVGTDKEITLPKNTTILTGNGTDTDGTISSYAWVKISGSSSATIVTANASSTAVNNLIPGIYKFELTVTDNNGATGRDTMQVTVNAEPNMAPIANAGSDHIITLPANNTILTGSGTDMDGTISNYSWVAISGPSSGAIATANAAITDVNNLAEGVYQFEFTVTDNEGAIAKDTVQVTVNVAPNEMPTANAGTDKAITLPANNTTLTGVGTDINGAVTSYSWIEISGPSQATIETANAAITDVNNLAEGVYQFEFTVTDNEGAIAKDTVQVTVNVAPNLAPVVNAGTDTVILAPTNKVTLTGSATVANSTISSYAWVKVSGPLSGRIGMADSATTLISKLAEGVYQYELTATDSSGKIGKDTVQIIVSKPVKHAPVVKAGSDTTITLPANAIILSGNSKNTDGSISSIAWLKISGPSSGTIAIANSMSTLVNDLVPGVYQYELKVTTNSGAMAKDTVQVTVNANADINQLPAVNQLTIANQLKVYPNPVRDIANLDITTNSSSKLTVSVFDMNGRLVKHNEAVNLNRNNIVKLDMSALRDGYYIITVRFDDGRQLSSKVIKYGGK
ncbi:MAG: tandem-95 repeat protein, partial [Ferruginibacter sp.]